MFFKVPLREASYNDTDTERCLFRTIKQINFLLILLYAVCYGTLGTLHCLDVSAVNESELCAIKEISFLYTKHLLSCI